jgi:hypothetical protein
MHVRREMMMSQETQEELQFFSGANLGLIPILHNEREKAQD